MNGCVRMQNNDNADNVVYMGISGSKYHGNH